jgi:cold shock CspA family protein
MASESTLWNRAAALVPAGRTPLVGDVAEFDDPRGLGVIEYGTGHRIEFHCTAITDGSRRIDVGTVVAFEVVAGRRWERGAPQPVGRPPGHRSVAPTSAGAVGTTGRAGSSRFLFGAGAPIVIRSAVRFGDVR